MGYDVARFQGDVDEDLICPICSGVLEEPVQVGSQLQSSVSVGEVMGSTAWGELRGLPVFPAAVGVRKLCSGMQLSIMWGPHLFVLLCSLEMPKDELPNHNCIKHLRSVVQQQQTRIAELEKTSAEHKHQLAEQKRDIQLLKAYMRAIRSVNPNLQNLEETIEYNEILEWVNSLQPARVTRWGGMISTPDAVLQAVIKRSLVESGCPTSIINELIENAHERNWPQGLATLETRQMNRRYYENYVAKRIPGKQAVVVMACENQHMGEDMVLEPGLVMIFAHGVEEI
uniref:Ring finger protein 41 n=1 Tax=Pavo cristatus TaxID=9049 RepID=A0A8C9FFM7_PAVCR